MNKEIIKGIKESKFGFMTNFRINPDTEEIEFISISLVPNPPKGCEIKLVDFEDI